MRLADHPSPPGCRRREKSGPRGHRGRRERDRSPRLSFAPSGVCCCVYLRLDRVRAVRSENACLMAETTSTCRELFGNMWVYGSFLPSDFRTLMLLRAWLEKSGGRGASVYLSVGVWWGWGVYQCTTLT